MEVRVARLTDKVAVVTGAATGIGRQIALLYAEEGARVVVSDVRAAEGEETVDRIRKAGGQAVFVKTDVSKSRDVAALVDAAEQEFGALHVMTANAGIMGRGTKKSLVEIAEDEFREIMAVNFDGVWLAFRHAIPAIERAGGGAMTATASLSAHLGSGKLPAYCASKGAVVALVRSVAADLAPRIRVNAVSPGAVATELVAHTAEALGVDPSTLAPTVTGWDGAADPREIAQAHLFLVSEESRFVNGQALIVDGGRSSFL
jgi:NAD(P)-dependent dehydrogenase (short-subunit alcohol dehydrogenase family)